MKIKRKLALRVIAALRVAAHSEAAMSQEPDLISKEATREWHDANAIEKALKVKDELKASAPPAPSLTCNRMVILLQLYRGTLASETNPGTFGADLQILERLGYAVESSKPDHAKHCFGWTITLAGKQRCEDALK